MKKAIVLSSGGVDSTTCVSIAVDELGKENVTTVSVIYGQKHIKEIECADKVAKYYGVNHKVIDLSGAHIFDDSNCSLLQGSTAEVPEETYAEQIAKLDGNKGVSTFVPYRNGLMLSSVAALAVSMYPDDDVDIYIGAHADDAAGNAYADCSKEFTDTVAKSIEIGTYGRVHLKAPLVTWNKAQVVKKGLELGTPYQLTWSCYRGKELACGTQCATCMDRINAFRENRVIDPIQYAVNIDWTGCNKIEYLKDCYHD